MSDNYDFENLSPIEFEALCVDLLSADLGLDFERFSPGADGGIDGRHSSAAGDRILQAKHYKNSTWSDLKRATKKESANVSSLAPQEYHFHTSQGLTPDRKKELASLLSHPSVSTGNIWGRAELNDRLGKHPKVERRNIKLWLSSAAVLERVVHNDIAVFTEATEEEISRILRVYVENPSLASAAQILEKGHSLIISGPPGVGKTTLAQVLAAEYSDSDWELIAIAEIEHALAAFKSDEKQVFIFDDFLGKIKLDPASLAKNEGRLSRLIASISKQENKRFIMTTRSYLFQAAKEMSEALDSDVMNLSELVLDLSIYTRENRAKILYNHLYHSDLPQGALDAVVSGGHAKRIIDHSNYMPRVVQWMTDQGQIEHVDDAEYPNFFLATLDKPEKIWEKAFRKHISEQARLLLFGMFFIERVSFPNPGVPLVRLQTLFSGLVQSADIYAPSQSSVRFFEETLRELKSSFLVVEGDKANFINPSVLDFLSNEVVDLEVLDMVASAACHVDEVYKVWSIAQPSFSDSDASIEQIARTIQNVIVTGELDGRFSFRRAAKLVGNLLLAASNEELVDFIRSGEMAPLVWVNEVDFINTIKDLEVGEYSLLPHSKSYARLLRQQLYGYVIDGEYLVDLDEAVDLVERVYDSSVEFPEGFTRSVDSTLSLAVEMLDPDSLDSDDDPESVLGGWIEQIEKAELYSDDVDISIKKDEIIQALGVFQLHLESQMEEYRESTKFHSSASSEGSSSNLLARDGQTFSDNDVDSLFSSLKSED